MASTLYTSGTLVTSDSLNAFDRASYTQLTALGGTADNLTATGPVSMTAYLTGLRFFFTPSAPNTTNVTININGLGNRAITKLGNTLLIAGDLIAGKVAEIVYDGLGFQLLNPQTTTLVSPTGVLPVANGGTGATTGSQALINLGATGRLIGTQTFLASGTYTPTAGTNSIVVELVGGGGAGGGAPATAAGQQSTGTGGGSGAYTKARLTSGFSGASVTVGAGGTPVSGAPGGNGGASSFGAGITAPGGIGGPITAASAGPLIVAAGAGGAVGIGGNILAVAGNYGEPAHMPPVATGLPVLTPRGAGGPFGGWTSVQGGGGAAIAGAANTGSGGAAASNNASAAAIAGGAGGSGIVIIYEYS